MTAVTEKPKSIADHITSTPGVCGGKPCIAGTRISVLDIYAAHELGGLTPDEIVSQYPTISLADVHSALAYYYDHRNEIEQSYKDCDLAIEEVKKALGPDRCKQL